MLDKNIIFYIFSVFLVISVVMIIIILKFKYNSLLKNIIKYMPAVFSIILLLLMLNDLANSFDSFYINKFQNWYDLTDSITDVEVYGQILYSYFILLEFYIKE